MSSLPYSSSNTVLVRRTEARILRDTFLLRLDDVRDQAGIPMLFNEMQNSDVPGYSAELNITANPYLPAFKSVSSAETDDNGLEGEPAIKLYTGTDAITQYLIDEGVFDEPNDPDADTQSSITVQFNHDFGQYRLYGKLYYSLTLLRSDGQATTIVSNIIDVELLNHEPDEQLPGK